MEGEENGENLTPFWVQSTTSLRRADRLRHRLSSFFFSSGLVVIVLLVTAVFFLVFVVPATISFSAKIFKPNSVKKSWDSLNIVLVLAAVVFGFLSRNRNGDRYYDEYQTSPNKKIQVQKSNPSSPHQWYDYDYSKNHQAQNSNASTRNQWCGYEDDQKKLYRSSTMTRTSSSYPDLRDFSSNWTYEDDPRRFYEDLRVDKYLVSESGQLHRRHRSLEAVDHETELIAKNIYVDHRRPKEVSNIPPLPSFPPSPPQKLESKASVGRKNERSTTEKEKDLDFRKPITSPKIPTPPPQPPPVSWPKSSRSDRKRGGGNASATKGFLNSLYPEKKKRERKKSVDNLDSLIHQTETPALHFHLPQPPPPPPPPPSVFLNTVSSKKPKTKGTTTVISPEPSQLNAERQPKPRTQFVPVITHKPLEPVKMNIGGKSPVISIPPPPPPPPQFFKTPAWKFVVHGDYVRVDSIASSRSGSPDLDDVDSDITPSSVDGGGRSPFRRSQLFCRSPDVNTKAESFITNFRAKLKLEKINSMNKKDVGLSKLGPGVGPSQI